MNLLTEQRAGLPAGITNLPPGCYDAERHADPLGDLTGAELWEVATERAREKIAARFVDDFGGELVAALADSSPEEWAALYQRFVSWRDAEAEVRQQMGRLELEGGGM